MKILYTEITERFPEIRSRLSEGDEESPYSLVIYLAEWLKDLGDNVTPAIAERVVAFTHWCKDQPEGKDASDDLHTILVVGFYEHLFDSASTRRLLPRLIPREDMIGNAEYLRCWVGADDYERALAEYK